ncbi:2-C-methyl-D-erythritol 2,4-cyclodiphosphate synthase [Solobacterium moorei]|uniref:2-C-methyl-D-erythritol 2,4-cyclodiphosphate synthase n=1 Tax=Solobacterium moorei TaxID=102148 RepID=UPI00040FE302|nr:2-C-methyl-D-erythritol 2,4-cyclodiphosphate synthase [Solobacterium moorei]BET20566.1 2-C-methyl-D-erythritol 2,4-cyclodiphosphate synthase [Solobacterium moorei]
MRIGQSTDIHRLAEGRKLILGGVEIPSDLGLVGHSDADALCHAIAEAILGALALGDLGKWFPDIDPKWEGADSIKILTQVGVMMREHGYSIGNVDSLIMIEKPKMAPHIMAMRDNIARALVCNLDCVSVKATRGEGLGFVGKSEGVQAQAVVLLVKED